MPATGHGPNFPRHEVGVGKVRYLRKYYAGVGYGTARRATAQGRTMNSRKRVTTFTQITWHEAVYLAGRLLARPEMWAGAMKRSAVLRGGLLTYRERSLASPSGAVAP